MFNRNRKPVLTESVCGPLEDMRTIFEVFFGDRVRFVHMDFNTRNGCIRVNGEYKRFNASFGDQHLVFNFGDGWHKGVVGAGFSGLAWAWNPSNPHVHNTAAGGVPMRWVGTGATDRHEEPLNHEAAEQLAKSVGMTLEELLETSPAQ